MNTYRLTTLSSSLSSIAFNRTDYLYRVAASGIFHDEEFKAITNSRFSTLAETPLIIEEKQLKEASLGQQENLFPFPHADSTIYSRRLYDRFIKMGSFQQSAMERPNTPSAPVLKAMGRTCISVEARHTTPWLLQPEKRGCGNTISTPAEKRGCGNTILTPPS